MAGAPLGQSLAIPGPVVDPAASRRARERLAGAAARDGWSATLDRAWPALAPVFGASPYLAALCRRWPSSLRRVLADPPEARLAALLASDVEAGGREAAAVERALRELKAEAHLLTALADLGGVWDLARVTGALSDVADLAVRAAFALAAREAMAAGRLSRLGEGPGSAVLPGLFCLAMGKLGARELNYSSDIDLTVFYDPAALPLAPAIEPAAFANRFVERVADLLRRRTTEGYVFRVDLRLRPDPSSTPVAVPAAAAFRYYETVGQNWERAAFIKARVIAGDLAGGEAFLRDLQPFVWRRNLDFAAIADIDAIRRQIQVHKVDDRLTAAGADLKLGRGGIREIEFFVQTQQLILGGRQADLRARGTLDALGALTRAGHVEAATAATLAAAYATLRGLEHRAQMIGDEQTHRLPEAAPARRAIAALAGYGRLASFDAAVGRMLREVSAACGRLFAGEEPLSSRRGSLIFTGVEDDPETLATLRRMGFADPERVSRTIRRWHHGAIGATRSERGRELFTRLAPRLLDALADTGAADPAFARFDDFFSRLAAGVQLQSLFLAQPTLLALIVRVMAYAPGFARTLAKRPGVLDALLDPTFFAPLGLKDDVEARLDAAGGFEAAMDEARRLHAEAAFRIGVKVLSGAAGAEAAGPAFTDLADGVIRGLARASLAEVERSAGPYPSQIAVIALGGCGARQMTARSDLDLMTLYRAEPGAEGSGPGRWSAATFHARFTQRLVAALSAPTRAGTLYAVDLQLRPSGTQGPVAVSQAAFEAYYAQAAETWEMLALTRARVVWATSAGFAADARAAVERALRRPGDPASMRRDVGEMRALMRRERPPLGVWDMKLSDGGLVDIEFCVQHLQLARAPGGGVLLSNIAEALDALEPDRTATQPDLARLRESWRLQQSLAQWLKIALDDGVDPGGEPAAFRLLLARAGGTRSFAALTRALASARRDTREIFARWFAPS